MVHARVDVLMPADHPAFPHVQEWANSHDVRMLTVQPESGDVLFMLSWPYKAWPVDYDKAYVIHESDLPKGRGWSPLAHQILEGKNSIPFTAIRADEGIDTGPAVLRETLTLSGYELADEIHAKSAEVKCKMMLEILLFPLQEVPQTGEPSHYARRTPKDSELDPDKTIREQFNLMRICDPRFPAFFELDGHRYEIQLKRL